MKQLFYSKTLRALFVLSCVFGGGFTALAQNFETHKVTMGNSGITSKSVKIQSASAFSVQKDNRVKWVTFKTTNKEVAIKVSANTTRNRRSCNLVLLDEKGIAVDTLVIEQYGNNSTSAVNSTSRLTGRATKVPSSKGVSGGQCAARTKKGARCSRRAAAGSIYCWQHNK